MVKDVVGRICDQRDFESHMNYLHINPVKHGLVTKVSDGLIQLFINWLSVAFIRKIGLGNLRYRVVSCYIKLGAHTYSKLIAVITNSYLNNS